MVNYFALPCLADRNIARQHEIRFECLTWQIILMRVCFSATSKWLCANALSSSASTSPGPLPTWQLQTAPPPPLGSWASARGSDLTKHSSCRRPGSAGLHSDPTTTTRTPCWIRISLAIRNSYTDRCINCVGHILGREIVQVMSQRFRTWWN